jgi:enhancing lycopene biosynthesis protein 2
MHVVNHLTGEVAEGETRNVLVEAARIPRGAVVDVAQVKAADYDAVVFPGGFGAAKNLCDFAVRGADAEAHPEVLRLVRECVEQGTPLGLACIAPAVCATAMKGSGREIELTVGRGADVSATLDAMGAKAVPRTVEEIHVDAAARVVTTPAYMEDAGIAQVARGIDAMVAKVLELAG